VSSLNAVLRGERTEAAQTVLADCPAGGGTGNRHTGAEKTKLNWPSALCGAWGRCCPCGRVGVSLRFVQDFTRSIRVECEWLLL